MLDSCVLNDLKVMLIKEGSKSISICLRNKHFNIYNVINSFDLSINEEEVSIESGNLILNIPIDDEFDIKSNKNEIENEYVLSNKYIELYINTLGNTYF